MHIIYGTCRGRHTESAVFLKMSLSTYELVKIVDSVLASKGYSDSCKMCSTFVDEVMNSGIQVPDIFKGWNGMNSRFCAVVVCISNEHVRGNTPVLPSFKKDVVGAVLTEVHAQYAKACKSSGFSFVPCTKGLLTILKRKRITA